jgi:hypothetical protein
MGRHDEATTEGFGSAQCVIRGEALREALEKALGIIVEGDGGGRD